MVCRGGTIPGDRTSNFITKIFIKISIITMARRVSHRELPTFGVHTSTKGVLPHEVDEYYGHAYFFEPQNMSRRDFHQALRHFLKFHASPDKPVVVLLPTKRTVAKAGVDWLSNVRIRAGEFTIERRRRFGGGTSIWDRHLAVLSPRDDERSLESARRAWRRKYGDAPMKGIGWENFHAEWIARLRKAELMRILNDWRRKQK